MDEWSIETKIPLYSEELISSFRKQLSIMVHSNWTFASDEAVIAKLDELGFTKRLMEEFDKALLFGPLNPELPDSCNYFRKDYPPIDWKTIGVRVGKSYLDSKRRSTFNEPTK